MSQMLNEGEFVVMDNGDLYQVVRNIIYNGEEYVAIGKQSTRVEDLVIDADENVYLCKINVVNDELKLDIIEDEEEMKRILNVN